MSLLSLSEISFKEYGNFVLNDISFTQQPLQKIAIAGETGSGKSTLLQIIAGLLQPHSGDLLFNSEPVPGPVERLVPGHKDIAYLSQQYELAGFLRVEQILAYANKLTEEEALSLYQVCQIDHLLKRKTNQLSGGERQRIALTLLLLGSPKLLLLDEPFSNLDMIHKSVLKTVIRDIGERLSITIILVSHDPLDTISWADQILVMKDGKIIQQGTPEEIYRQPVNTYVAGLFGSYNLLNSSATLALSALTGRVAKGNMLIRPECFEILPGQKNALPAEVTRVTFFGSYYETEVMLMGNPISIKTQAGNLKNGDTVFISLMADNVCFVP